MKDSGVSKLTTPDTSSASSPKAAPESAPPPLTKRRRSYWLHIALVSAAYALAAALGGLLQTPASPASILWPAAGLSLAVLLIKGPRLWPGIWLGAILYLFLIASPFPGAGVSILIATGATLQALIGAFLTRHLYQSSTHLTRERDIALFLLLGGPVSCLVSSTIASAGLYGAGYLTLDQAVGTFLLWWTADSIGVLLFAPLLIVSPIASGYFPRNALRITVPLLITAILLISANFTFKRLEEIQAHDDAEQLMEETLNSGFRQLPLAIEPLRGVERFFTTNKSLNQDEINSFANYIVQQPAVDSVDWAPRVKHAERSEFEASLQQKYHHNYRIFERDANDKQAPSEQRQEYFPVSLTIPSVNNNSANLGYDHSSESRRRDAMIRARDSGKITITSIVPLQRTTLPSILAFVPVYRSGFKANEASVSERRDSLIGFFVSVFTAQKLLSSVDRLAKHHNLLYRITDITFGEKPLVVHDTIKTNINTHWSRRVTFVNRTWQLEMYPAESYWQPWSSFTSRIYLGLSVMGAFLISFATLSAAGRNTATAVEVIERTAELARELQYRKEAEEEIHRLNLALERKVVERTRALNELHTKEEQLSAIVGNLPYGLVTIDSYGVIHSANPAMEQVLGYPPYELIGNNVSLLMPEPHRNMVDYISRYIKSDEMRIINSRREVEGLHKDGRTIPLELAISEYHVNGERFFIGSLWDISERKHIIDELTQARHGAEQASRAKSSFLAVMSHEIRTPMNGVIGLVDVLAHSRLSDYQAELVTTIRESASTLLDIIDDILDFSKIDAGRMTIEHNPVCIADLVEGLCTSLHPDAANKGVAMSLFISPQIPPLVLSDSIRLRQALSNLIGNAIKFTANQTRRKGCVSIRIFLTEPKPQHLAFEIIDNGIGMSQTTLDQLFTPFTQAEASTTRRFGGTGLGLAITHRLIELMQGEITVSSRQGAGSRFTITLPFDPAAEQPVRGEPELSGIRCIMLESAELNSSDLCAYLEDAGAEVFMVPDAPAAAHRASELTAPIVAIQDAMQQRPAVAPVLAEIKHLQHLQLTRGRRQRARLEDPNIVTLDYPILRRVSLVQAVGMAAGRVSPAYFHKESLPEFTEEISPPNIEEARAQDRLILVAEDDALNQQVILQQLALLGYAAEVASNGTDALRLWRKGTYALLLTDLQMPDMDGYTLASIIRDEEDQHHRIPILALTANALREESDQANEAGMDEYMTKPLQLRHLREVLEKWLPKHEPAPSLVASSELRHGSPSVDITVLHDMVGDDPETISGLLNDYTESLRHLTGELRSAYANNEIRQVFAITHKLKSSSRLVGALSLGDLCAEIELAAKTNNKTALDETMPHFEAAVTAVEAEIGKLLKKA